MGGNSGISLRRNETGMEKLDGKQRRAKILEYLKERITLEKYQNMLQLHVPLKMI